MGGYWQAGYPVTTAQTYTAAYSTPYPMPYVAGLQYPSGMPQMAPPMPGGYLAPRRSLPASVITAGVIMIIFGALLFLIITGTLLSGQSSASPWVAGLVYLIAVFNLAVPILMLMRKPWAYSMAVSILAANVLLVALDVLTSGALFVINAIPAVIAVLLVIGALFGLPLALLMSKKARRAFEGPRNPSAVVWAGGGYEYPGTEPFALHPSEMRNIVIMPPVMANYPVYSPPPAFSPPTTTSGWGSAQVPAAPMPGQPQWGPPTY